MDSSTNTQKNPAQKGKICPKTKKFAHNNFTLFIRKSFQIWDHFFPLLFSKDSKSIKKIWKCDFLEVGAKIFRDVKTYYRANNVGVKKFLS